MPFTLWPTAAFLGEAPRNEAPTLPLGQANRFVLCFL